MTKLLNLTSKITQPPYASALIIELSQSKRDQSYFIQVFLKNNTADQDISLHNMTIYGKLTYFS